MRCSLCWSLCLAGVLVCSSSQAQEAAPQSPAARRDPTAPSAEILRRLAAAAPGVDGMLNSPSDPAMADEIVEVVPAFPEPILKGIVMSDPDHGTALLEAGGRRVVVPLSRGASRLSGFCVQGIEFQVLDFSDRSLLLQAPDRPLLVQ